MPALLRDWLVMLICRPFFPIVVHHWHAAGFGGLASKANGAVKLLTRGLMGKPALGIALGWTNLRDPLWLLATRDRGSCPTGSLDPFPITTSVLSFAVQARLEARRRLLRSSQALPEHFTIGWQRPGTTFRLLYLGYCFREKGSSRLWKALPSR